MEYENVENLGNFTFFVLLNLGSLEIFLEEKDKLEVSTKLSIR